MGIDLKWNATAEGAIAQIKRNKYPDVLKNYGSEILLVGINYDKRQKISENMCVRLSKI